MSKRVSYVSQFLCLTEIKACTFFSEMGQSVITPMFVYIKHISNARVHPAAQKNSSRTVR